MYSKMIIPLDGSRLSECVLPYARLLASKLKIPLELVQAVDPDVVRAICDPSKGLYFDKVELGLSRNSLEYLQGIARSFPEAVSVHCFAEAGEPAHLILNRAAEPDGLIAMATRGYSGLQRWLLGSVADRVLHETSKPLLLIREDDQLKTAGEAVLGKVVVALDGSELAEIVLPHVKTLAEKLSLEVILLRAYAPPTQGYAGTIYSISMQEAEEAMKEQANAYLKSKVEELLADGVRRVSSVVLKGNPAGELIDFAQRTASSLMAMTTHGRTGVARRLLGSVAARVIRHCGGPVLVVRPTLET